MHQIPGEEVLTQQEEVKYFVQSVTSHLPASKERLEVYRQAQSTDPTCSAVMSYCTAGWPRKQMLTDNLLPYWKVRGQLSLYDDLLLYRSRIVVPAKLQQTTLYKTHQGHQGIQRCRLRIASSVWWPGVSKAIEHYVQNCPQCLKSHISPKEPLITSTLPNQTWQKVAADLFELNKSQYLLIVDYFSRYPEVFQLNSTTSSSIVKVLKATFAHHGVPSILFTDNGPQFSSQNMKDFASAYSFRHITSSPRYPQSNGFVERTVGTMKRFLQHAHDPYMAILSFRATPLPWCMLSPAELLFGRKINTDLPQTDHCLIPQWTYLERFQKADKVYKDKQQSQYDRRYRTRSLAALLVGSKEWVRSERHRIAGKIVSSAGSPRSYIVSTPSGQLRRNRHHLNI